ncbi:MAG TPA: DUF2934 domain-containing protein [Terriglobales bacterium]|jgi:hypothetical protein|nr:DUF2934 domain-containing protein [Terriglobales bacterium]
MSVDAERLAQEPRGFVVDLIERKIRLRAHQLYEQRGYVEGHAVEDWLQAESEVLETSILAPLYRRSRSGDQPSVEIESERSGSR